MLQVLAIQKSSSKTMNENLLQPLRDQIAAAGLQPYETALLDAAGVAVEIELDGAPQNTIGESRFGGAPDFPADWQWPIQSRHDRRQGKKMNFLLQINLADVLDFTARPLPQRGVLSFFIGDDESAFYVENRVFLFEDAALQATTMPNEDEFASDAYLDLVSRHLKFSLRAQLPKWGTASGDVVTQDMNDNEQDALLDLPLRLPNSVGQILGHVSGICHDPCEGVSRMRNFNPERLEDHKKSSDMDFFAPINWLNLLRLDSIMELDFLIWDAGYLNFLIHRDDLAKLDFSRVYAAVESS